jgi:acetyl-CoA/propionyl-CoA carboxylase biotin carboxyl carrier protein
VSYRIGTRRTRHGRRSSGQGDQFEHGRWVLLSPIAGTIYELKVAEGESVEANAVLLIVEAMKMQNDLRARVSGRIKKINVTPGQRVEVGAALLEIEEVPAT